MSGLMLTGLCGENPLAFLAALGTLTLLNDGRNPSSLMAWRTGEDGHWHPTLHDTELTTREALLGRMLDAHAQRDLDAEFGWAPKGKKGKSSGDFRGKLARNDVRRLLEHSDVDSPAARFIAACVAELPERPGRDGRPPTSPHTPLRLKAPGDGTMDKGMFLGTARQESELGDQGKPRAEDMEACLFAPWHYHTNVKSLYWDPAAPTTMPAHREQSAMKPSYLGVKGATLLAVRGLSMFPLMPQHGRRGARPPGMPSSDRFVWPLWKHALGIAEIRMLLFTGWQHELQHSTPKKRRQHAARCLLANGVTTCCSAPVEDRGAGGARLGHASIITTDKPVDSMFGRSEEEATA